MTPDDLMLPWLWAIGATAMLAGGAGTAAAKQLATAVAWATIAAVGGLMIWTAPGPAPWPVWRVTATIGTCGLLALPWWRCHRIQATGLWAVGIATLLTVTIAMSRFAHETG